jgi:hypothetical protein
MHGVFLSLVSGCHGMETQKTSLTGTFWNKKWSSDEQFDLSFLMRPFNSIDWILLFRFDGRALLDPINLRMNPSRTDILSEEKADLESQLNYERYHYLVELLRKNRIFSLYWIFWTFLSDCFGKFNVCWNVILILLMV